jgi:hypothetical protein
MFTVGRIYRDSRGLFRVLKIDPAGRRVDYERTDGAVHDGIDARSLWSSSELVSGSESAVAATQFHFSQESRPIREFVQRRGLRALLHFTKLRNVSSIVRHGLVPVSEFAAHGIPVDHRNDHSRIDGHLGATSLSVSFPNYRMFYRLRCERPDEGWAVLAFPLSVLWTFHCAFYPTNAAANSMRILPPDSQGDAGALAQLFGDRPGVRRNSLTLEGHETTDPQAEVLVFGILPAALIRSVHVLMDVHRPPLVDSGVDSSILRTSPGLFGPRRDYAAWRGPEISDVSSGEYGVEDVS